MKREKSCGIIPIKDNTILLICHKNGLHWDFPKGHVEPFESEEETALRELKEETGLDASIVSGFREVISYSPKTDVQKKVVFFIGIASGEVVIQISEVMKARWLSYEDARKLLTYPSAKELLDKAQSFLDKKI